MRISTTAAAVFLATTVCAAAQDQDPSPSLDRHETCFVMKQRVLSVSNARVAIVDNPGVPTTITTNHSGNTVRSDEAKHDILSGDSACENNDAVSARAYYQRAIDALTSTD